MTLDPEQWMVIDLSGRSTAHASTVAILPPRRAAAGSTDAAPTELELDYEAAWAGWESSADGQVVDATGDWIVAAAP